MLPTLVLTLSRDDSACVHVEGYHVWHYVCTCVNVCVCVSALGTCRRTSRIHPLEVLGHIDRMPSNAHVHHPWYNTCSMAAAGRIAYTALTLGTVPFGFSTI